MQAFVAAAVPATVFSILIWILDKYEREPLPLMMGAFLWGAIPAAVGSLIAEVFFETPLLFLVGEVPTQVIGIALGAPVIEEIAKGLTLLLLVLFFSKEIDGMMDGILYGALIGFGFAMTENVLYLVGCGLWFGIECQSLAFLRTVVFGLNHAFYTSLTGAALGYALTKRDARRWLVPPLGLWAAMLSHMLHNLASIIDSFAELEVVGIILAVIPDWGTILLLGAVIFLAWQRERFWMEAHLPSEVAQGVISADEYQTLMSWRRRAGAQLSALLRGGWRRALAVRRRQFAATELAFYKERLARGEKIDEALLIRLRKQLRGGLQEAVASNSVNLEA